MSYFALKFSQTSGNPFIMDKNGNYPYIGTIIAGKAKSTIMNGTIFQREKLSTDKVYLATTREVKFTRDDGTENLQHEIVIISPMSPLEVIDAVDKLGVAQFIGKTSEEEVEDPAEVEADNLV